MATIRQRVNGKGEVRWGVQVRVAGQPAESATFLKRADAVRWAAQREHEARERRAFGRRRRGAQLLSEAIDRYVSEHLPYLAETVQRGRLSLLTYWRERYGHFRLGELEPDHFVRAISELAARGLSARTQNHYISAVSRVLTIASREWGWLGENPARQITRRKETTGRTRYLSDAERERLLDACRRSRNRKLYPLVVLALATGARQGELLGLDWRDVDLARRLVTFRGTKNGEDRTVPLSAPARSVLDGLGPQDAGSVLGLEAFPKGAFKSATRSADVREFRFHDLRHTAASALAMSGATLYELKTFLGHKTLAMVGHYAHLTESHLSGLAEKMAGRFLKLPGQDDPATTD